MGAQRGPPGTDLSGGPRAGSRHGSCWRRESAGERRGYGNTAEGNPLGSGGAMEILQKGIRWGAAGLWKYYRRESAGEWRGYGNTTKGNPLGSGGAMEILQKGIRWGAAGLWKYYRRESAGDRRGYGNTTEGNPLGSGHGNGVGGGWGALTGLTPQCERGEQRGRGGKIA